MLQVGINCYYIALQKKARNIGDWYGASLITKKSKKGNPNNYLLENK